MSFWNLLGLGRPLNEPSAYEDDPAWQARRLDFDAVGSKIPNGSHLFIGSTAATAHRTLEAIVKGDRRLLDVTVVQFIPGGSAPHLTNGERNFRTTTFFPSGITGQKIREGIADYAPISSARVRRLIRERRLPIDVAIVKVTPPDADGRVSLGTGVDFSFDAVEAADLVIAEVCAHMPWTEGSSVFPAERIDWWTVNPAPMPTTDLLFPSDGPFQIPNYVIERIAANVLFEIPDGATLKFDLSPVADRLAPYLRDRNDLGLHTELLTDPLGELIRQGVITNARKNVDVGRSMVTHAYGSKALYELVHRNEAVTFQSAFELNRIDRLAGLENLVSIVGGLKVDLSGQVAIDSVGSRFYAGPGSVDDSIRGAGYARGGKPIVALPALSPAGNSNIVFSLPEGTGVGITRVDTHYVVTEYGTAFLFGKSIRERCLALIDIAHPEHRDQLLEQAKDSFYIREQQLGASFRSTYPKQWESVHATPGGREVLVRPIKAIDEDLLRDFFHKLSDQNVYMRYFTRVRSLPQRVLMSLSDIDYSKDMALVVLSPPETAQHEIVAIAQWIMDPDDGTREIAFQVRDDWQGEGLGRFLFGKLVEMARSYRITRLKADVLVDNEPMNRIFETSKLPHERKVAFNVVTYCFELG